MKARDVMASPVITVRPSASTRDVARTLLDNRISAVPVVDDAGKVIGIISEGDLLHRVEAGTESHRPWWLRIFVSGEALAAEYVKAHGHVAADIMTRSVISA